MDSSEFKFWGYASDGLASHPGVEGRGGEGRGGGSKNTANCSVKVEWYSIYGPKSLLKFGEKRPIVCYYTHEQKMDFQGFTQNGCYGNQPRSFEVVL